MAATARTAQRVSTAQRARAAAPSPRGRLVAPTTADSRLVGTIGKLRIEGERGDIALLRRVHAALAQSATGAALLSRMARAGGRVQVLDSRTYDKLLDRRTMAAYDSRDGVIFLRRETLRADARVAATVLAHEGVHLLDDARGLMDAAHADALRGAKLASDPDEYLRQQAWLLQMVTETHAHMTEARVARELGVRYDHSYPGAVAPDGSLRTFEQTWRALEQGPYNPDNRSGTPRDR